MESRIYRFEKQTYDRDIKDFTKKLSMTLKESKLQIKSLVFKEGSL